VINSEIKRLEYQPKLKYNEIIDTKLTTTILTNSVVDTRSDILKAYSDYNIGDTYDSAILLLQNMEDLVDSIKNDISKDDIYNGLLEIDDTDYTGIEDYVSKAREIDGDVNVELYPLLKYIKDDTYNMLNKVNEFFYNNNIDYDNLDKYKSYQDTYINSLTQSEKDNLDIDYKSLGVEIQINKFLNDRIKYLTNFLTICNSNKQQRNFILPNDNSIVNNYYNNVKNINNEDRIKMKCFDSSNILYKILENIYTYKTNMVNNRTILLSANKKTFFSLLSIAKENEDKLSNSILDLFKYQFTDEINKGDYIDTLIVKNSIREFYKTLNLI